ncbi:triose-phosphate isomerase [Lichenihabitans sp. Uapishka_5]|uniref:triose-phosphate isomerase n=1 Tax=Lichenihabitans sp. Uapishka_5 TaxID=3037302 RepID=UPI0029E80DD6|nr:triose-phosphate isomerase [Lichenihabitans sp. Uapishka_5]MDX7951945.1 triose-phosphate isomerase [Lichenihabitans sp. Uapishka_5]
MAFSSRPIVIGNWKMNGLAASLDQVEAVRDAIAKGQAGRCETGLCLPATLIAAAAARVEGSRLMIGGQDCHVASHGAHTGDIAAAMLKDAGATLVIVGHSERRADHGETDMLVNQKAQAAALAGLTPVICVGETRAERDAGETLRVIGRQIDESVPRSTDPKTTIVAYEPVWAIGTGLTPTAADVAEVHAFIHRRLDSLLPSGGTTIRILYGGSVKASNAAELLAIDHVDGALVGGASLKAADLLGITSVYR